MSNLDKKIADEVGAMHLSALLDESWRWLTILKDDPPTDWTPGIVSDMELSLTELREIVERQDLSVEKHKEAYDRLRGYCIRMRRRNGGASPKDRS